jgi:hypothetical protein
MHFRWGVKAMRADLPFLGGMAAIAVTFPLADAYAYLDPGTGSFVLQMLLGGIAGMMVVARLYWEKLKLAIGRTFNRASSSEQTEKRQ